MKPVQIDPREIGPRITVSDIAKFATCSSMAPTGCRGTGRIVTFHEGQRQVGNCRCAWAGLKKEAGHRVAIQVHPDGVAFFWKRGMDPYNWPAYERFLASMRSFQLEQQMRGLYVELYPGRTIIAHDKILMPWAKVGYFWVRFRATDLTAIHSICIKGDMKFDTARAHVGPVSSVVIVSNLDMLKRAFAACDWAATEDGYTLCR